MLQLVVKSPDLSDSEIVLNISGEAAGPSSLPDLSVTDSKGYTSRRDESHDCHGQEINYSIDLNPLLAGQEAVLALTIKAAGSLPFSQRQEELGSCHCGSGLQK